MKVFDKVGISYFKPRIGIDYMVTAVDFEVEPGAGFVNDLGHDFTFIFVKDKEGYKMRAGEELVNTHDEVMMLSFEGGTVTWWN